MSQAAESSAEAKVDDRPPLTLQPRTHTAPGLRSPHHVTFYAKAGNQWWELFNNQWIKMDKAPGSDLFS